MTRLFDAASLPSSARLKNRFALSPMTNCQSHADGSLGEDEFHWLKMRAEGGFSLVMTCAAAVSPSGIGFPGQLGFYHERHLEGLTRFAATLKAPGAHAVAQLHHGGMRADKSLVEGPPLCPSDNEKNGARAMTDAEVQRAIAEFIDAAMLAERAGFDGVELHAAHGYLICQFLSPGINQRTDSYGGSQANRERFLFEIIEGVRAACKPGFSLGVRLSPERFDMDTSESIDLAGRLLNDPRIDYVDMSLWDVFKEPNDPKYKGERLIDLFTRLPRGRTLLGVAGKIANKQDAEACLDAGADFVFIGKAGIFHHDLPNRIAADPNFEPLTQPVAPEHLRAEGVSEPFLNYLRGFGNLVGP